MISNPLDAKIGSFISLDILDYRDKHFLVEDIIQYTRVIDNKTFIFTDYALPDGLSLRMMEGEALLLHTHDQFGFDEQFLENVNNACSGTFNIDSEDAHFQRCNNTLDSYIATLTFMSGKQESNEYWDWERTTKDEADFEYQEYLFIEKDEETGFFTLWRGFEVPKESIRVAK